MKAPGANEVSMSTEAPERVPATEEKQPNSARTSSLCEFDSAGATLSHVSEEVIPDTVAQSNLMVVDLSAEQITEMDEGVVHLPPPGASVPMPVPEAAAAADAEAEAKTESAAAVPAILPLPEGATAQAATPAPIVETTVVTPTPEVAARQMQEMWENLGKGYKVDWQNQDIGIDIGARPNKRQKLKQKQQNLLTTSHDQQGASAAQTDTDKDGIDNRQIQKKPGEEKPQKTPNDKNVSNHSSEMSSKPEQSTVEVGSNVGQVKKSPHSSGRKACGQWMPRGGRCSRCRGKTSDEFGGVVCRRRRADGEEVGCCKGVCWRCMKPTPGDDVGKIRITKHDFLALGKRAWWLHESCMTSIDEADFFSLIMPTPA